MRRTLALLAFAFALLTLEAHAQPIPAGVAQYAPPAQGFAPPAALASHYALCVRAAAAHGRTITPDALTAATAQMLAEQLAGEPNRRPLTYTSGRSLVNATGQVDHDVVWQTWWIPDGSPQPDVATAVGSMVDSTSNLAYDRVGVGRAQGPGLTLLVAVLALRGASLTAPVPRLVRPGGTVSVRARLGPGLREPWVDLTTPEGRVTVLRPGPGPELAFEVPTPGPGIYQIELSARGSAGPRPALNFFLYASATPPPLAFERTGTADPPDRVETELFRLINEARRRAGLPLVRLNTNLSRVARAHSQDMADHHFEGHDSPTTGTPSDRVARAGIRTNLVLENVDGGFSAEDIHESFMASPGHRISVLDPRVTDVGLGAALEHNAGGDSVMATEEFISVLAPLDTAAQPALVLARINARRAERHAPPLSPQPVLARFAETIAQAYFAPDALSTAQLQDRARASLNSTGVHYVNSLVQVLTLNTPEEAAENSWLLDPALDALGIAFSQGNRPDAPPNQLVVTMVGVGTSLPAQDTTQLALTLRAQLDSARRSAGAPALTSDPRLDAFAASAAASFFAGNDAPASVQDRARAGVSHVGLTFSHAMVLAAPTAHPETLLAEAWLRRPDLRVGALAVTQGTRPDTLRNQLFVVLVLVGP